MKPSDDLKKEIYKGKDSQTIEEICKETALSESVVRVHARKMVKMGIWNQVWRKHTKGFIQAYVKVK